MTGRLLYRPMHRSDRYPEARYGDNFRDVASTSSYGSIAQDSRSWATRSTFSLHRKLLGRWKSAGASPHEPTSKDPGSNPDHEQGFAGLRGPFQIGAKVIVDHGLNPILLRYPLSPTSLNHDRAVGCGGSDGTGDNAGGVHVRGHLRYASFQSGGPREVFFRRQSGEHSMAAGAFPNYGWAL